MIIMIDAGFEEIIRLRCRNWNLRMVFVGLMLFAA
ncbi:hypothetical protein AL07_10125 [Corynebacterium diphtheriae bv. gravis str. ISS 4060]|nr:hypothetical protein AL07_10125 [Corynebacterium diphtheriae bv. gravis str. ISS 4060]